MVAETDHTLFIGSDISLEQLKLPISLQCSGSRKWGATGPSDNSEGGPANQYFPLLILN